MQTILAITMSFSMLHLPTGVPVQTVVTETFQAPIAAAECARLAAEREAQLRRMMNALGIRDARFRHACAPAGEVDR